MKLEIFEKAQLPLWRFQTLSPEIMVRQALLTLELAKALKSFRIILENLEDEILEGEAASGCAVDAARTSSACRLP